MFTKNELAFIADLLDMAADEFSNHSCNDFKIDNTAENKLLLMKIADSAEEKDSILNNDSKTLYTCDWLLMRYFANKCKNISQKKWRNK